MWSRSALLRRAALAAVTALPMVAAPLQFRTRELPRAVFGAAYRAVIATDMDGRCPSSDVVLELAGGRLPRGIDLAGDVLAGVAKEFGVFPLRLRAVNTCAAAVQELTLEVTGKPILRVLPERLTIDYREGDPLPQPQVLLVSGSWDDLVYSMEAAKAPWLRFRAQRGATPYAGSAYTGDSVNIQAVPDGLAPGTYQAVLSFSTDGGANIPEVPITFHVIAK